MFIPLRVMTAIIGALLGYMAGTYVEILYEKQGDYYHEVATLLTGVKYGMLKIPPDCFSDCDDDMPFFIDSYVDSGTDTSESED
jgi:hypothetical protein